MIYAVEMALGPDMTEADWDEWMAGMKPPGLLLSVPGLTSVQRFRGQNMRPARYLAVYTIDAPAILASVAYKSIGGGSLQQTRWRDHVTLWTRDLFDGIDEAPPVDLDQAVVIVDAPAPFALDPAFQCNWTEAVGLDCSTPWRGWSICSATWAADNAARLPGDARVYHPFMGIALQVACR